VNRRTFLPTLAAATGQSTLPARFSGFSHGLPRRSRPADLLIVLRHGVECDRAGMFAFFMQRYLVEGLTMGAVK
jgi:hypothetical protein